MEGWTADISPFHQGEQALHARLGIAERQDQLGRRMMRPFMPDQHRDFFAQLPFVIMGSVDPSGAPWASILTGTPGFVSTPSDRAMRIASRPFEGDPMSDGIARDAPVSLLGIEPHTRRRNRANFLVEQSDADGIDLRLTMSFGNCPQYIQARRLEAWMPPANAPKRDEIVHVTDEVATWIRAADTFYVASHNDRDDPKTIGGVDVNHRGGRPGFIKIEGNVLTIPDFRGNNAFNTFGNFVVNPRAGLLFLDFDTGDVLQMTGRVELLFDEDESVTGFAGARRLWRFTFERGHILRGAAAGRWTFESYATQLDATGSWGE